MGKGKGLQSGSCSMVNHAQVSETKKKEVLYRGEEKVKRRDCYNHSALL